MIFSSLFQISFSCRVVFWCLRHPVPSPFSLVHADLVSPTRLACIFRFFFCLPTSYLLVVLYRRFLYWLHIMPAGEENTHLLRPFTIHPSIHPVFFFLFFSFFLTKFSQNSRKEMIFCILSVFYPVMYNTIGNISFIIFTLTAHLYPV